MKALLLIIVLLASMSVMADSFQNKNQDLQSEKFRQKSLPKALSIFDVIPLNSPVKDSVAKFLFKIPDRFEIDEVKFKVKNASRLFEKDHAFQKIKLITGAEGKELHIPISQLPPGFYQLFVKVRNRKYKEYNYKNKIKDYAVFVVDNHLEVKIPDPKINNTTLLGVDSDNDGIRDDIQIWINQEFNKKPLELKLAFKHYATQMQIAMLTSNDKEASILASHATIKSQICLYEVGDFFGVSDKEQELIRQKIKLMYLNTIERIEAEIRADKNFHGQSGTMLSREEACDF